MKQAAFLGFSLTAMMATAWGQVPEVPLYPVQVGTIACDAKVVVTITEQAKNPNHYDIAVDKMHYEAERVMTKSGAVKLEDAKDGIAWLQMSNKSMLMDEKHHKRIAVDCRDDAQNTVQKELDAIH